MLSAAADVYIAVFLLFLLLLSGIGLNNITPPSLGGDAFCVCA